MSDYPKVIVVDGVTITATDAEDEARWRKKPHNPLNDVVLEMDDPTYSRETPPVAPYDITTDTQPPVVETPAPVTPKKAEKKSKKK